MRRPWLIPILLLALGTVPVAHPAPAQAAGAKAENGCLACHGSLPPDTRMARRHLDFIGSVHDKAGLGCNDCHGGDPKQTDKDKAHKGVLPASDENSRIYFRNVPRTCGRCHQAQLEAFSKSRHFARLETTGRGPNCVTCHGSMATRILKASDVEGFCTVCHNERLGLLPDKPAQAEATLNMMDAVRTLVAWAREMTDAARAGGADTKAAERRLAEASGELGQAAGAWHTFNLPAVQDHLAKAAAAARATRAALPPAAPARR
jgi:nitrate/TMAO reductase-like tetraheme cytochrome c subunit